MNRKTALRKLRRIVALPKHQWRVIAQPSPGNKVRVALEKKTHSQSGSRKLMLEVVDVNYRNAVAQFERRYDQ